MSREHSRVDRWYVLLTVIVWAIAAVLTTKVYGQTTLPSTTQPRPVQAWLIDATTQRQARALHDDDEISGPLIGVNLQFQPSVPRTSYQSVRVYLDGKYNQGGPEGNPPFSVFGDVTGKFNAGTIGVGQHLLDAICYPQWGSGLPVERFLLHFTVTPPPASRPAITVDTTTLVNPPWPVFSLVATRTALAQDTIYVVPRGWPKCSARLWTMEGITATGHQRPRIRFTDPTYDACLFEFSSTSYGNTLRGFDVEIAPDVTTHRSGFKLGGSFNTLDDIGAGGGAGHAFWVKDEDSRSLRLLNLHSIADVGGNFLFVGASRSGECEDLLIQGLRVTHAIASPYGIGHPLRAFDITGATLRDNFVDVTSSKKYTQYPNATYTSGIRLHRGHDFNLTGGSYTGFQSWIGPLTGDQPPVYNVTCDGVTFGNSLTVTSWATNVTFTNCTFTTGSSWAVTMNAGSTGRFVNCKFVTTANNTVFDHTGGSWTFSGCTRNSIPWR